MIGLTFCRAAAYAICFVMVFDRMGNTQGVVCDIWLIWLAVLVLHMRCFKACFSTRDGSGDGGDAILSRPVSFHSLPWFGLCHLGIAGVCLRLIMQLRIAMFGCRGLSCLQASESMVQLMAINCDWYEACRPIDFLPTCGEGCWLQQWFDILALDHQR